MPYLEQGNIYFVPVLRHHLNFAVQVQKAAELLGLGPEDLVAVGLPESVRERTLEAIGKLPRVSLVISSVSDSDQREVFPITPADGIVEAIRLATERHVPLRFVDQEIAPGNLVDHFCVADEDWPDDGLALTHGAEWYLDLIAERLAHPPSRFEPVDTWRELHMAAELQRLHPRHRRVLFVCHAAHVRPIQQLIRQPVPPADAAGSALPPAHYRIWEPSLPILVRYLDYIPRLVEMYERRRADGRAHEFDKLDALLELIYLMNQEATDLRFSIRHYQAFSQVLTKLLEQEKRISPQFDAVLLASGSCFNGPFRERVFRHLAGYFDQVKVERIGRVLSTRESLFEVSLTNPGSRRDLFVARNCTYFEHSYEVVYPPGTHEPPHADGTVPNFAPDLSPDQIEEVELDYPTPPRRPRWPFAGDAETNLSWPPADWFVNEMRQKAYNLVQVIEDRQVKSMEFQGSLHDGIDFRRTLRSHYRRQPRLYVKKHVSKKRNGIDRNEPIFWLFDGYNSVTPDTPTCEFDFSRTGRDSDPAVEEWFFWKPLWEKQDLKNKYGDPVAVSCHEVYGRVTFLDRSITFEDALSRLGGDLDRRVPKAELIRDPDHVRRLLSGRYDLDLTPTRWWDTMLMAAVEHAKETVVLFAPQKFVIPADVIKRAASRGKRIVQFPLTRFTHEELRRLRVQYFLYYRYPKSHADLNDPEHLAYVHTRFEDVMKLFWE
jgi:hypothetical protein